MESNVTDYFNIPRKYPSLNSGKITSLTTLILLLILTCFTSQVTAESMTQLLERQSPTELAQAARLQGDASRGAVLFFQPYMSCAKCHDADSGISLGPDISKSGKETTAEHLIESLLAPSKVIKKGYETLSVQTVDGKVISGFMHEEKDGFLTLTDPAGGKQVKIPIADIEQRSISTKSLMPEGLINQLSDRQQFLDLTKYLIEIAAGGPVRAKDLRPAQTVFTLPEYEKHIDHAGLLNKLDNESFARGEVIYSRVCANCHGTLDMPG
jgi:putative heme-binding domain-containing protein